MLKYLPMLMALIFITGCATVPHNQFMLTVNSEKGVNDNDNILIIYEQPSSIQQMVKTNYNDLSQEVLNANHQIKLIHPQNGSSDIVFSTKNEPASLYIVLNNANKNSNWKYYISNPTGKNWDCNISKTGYINCNK